MRLAIILATLGLCGLGYSMYSSVKAAHELARVEGEVGQMLDQLEEHVHTYTQYYERTTWEKHTAIQMTEQGMALPQGEQRDVLRVQMGKYVKQYNMYKNDMAPFAEQELHKAWNIALELKNKELHNPEQAALFSKYWEDMVPYMLYEEYFHATLPSNKKHRQQIVEQTNKLIIKRKQEYIQTHNQRLQWEQDYAYMQGEQLMAKAELATAKQDMEEADYALALALSDNSSQEVINKASAHAAEQQYWYNQACMKAEEVDNAMIQLETQSFDMVPSVEESMEQVIMQQQPNRGVPVVPGTAVQQPGGSWWSEFTQWLWSWIF